MTEKFQLLSVIIASQCLLRTLHIENMKEKVGVLIFHFVVERCSIH